MGSKLYEWLSRYLPAEMLAIACALLGGLSAHYLFHNILLTAFVSTWFDNFGYYGSILFSDVRERIKRDEKITVAGVIKVVRNIVVEFGPGEYLDSFLIRPAITYLSLRVTGNVPLGLILGKICADVTFYIPTIFAYEFRKKYFRD